MEGREALTLTELCVTNSFGRRQQSGIQRLKDTLLYDPEHAHANADKDKSHPDGMAQRQADSNGNTFEHGLSLRAD